MVDPNEYDYLVKVLLIGNSGVGKTCIIQRFVREDFSVNYLPTIAVDFKLKIFEVDNLKLKMQIWDTAGQERFNTLTANFFKAAHGIIVVFSVVDKLSFDNISKWVAQIQNSAPKTVQVILVGNKKDLDTQRVISYEQGEECAKKYGGHYFEVSALTGENIKEMFIKMGQLVSKEMNLSKSDFRVGQSGITPEKDKKCCE